MRKATAYSILRSRGNRDRAGRYVRNKAAYTSGMVKKANQRRGSRYPYRGRRY